MTMRFPGNASADAVLKLAQNCVALEYRLVQMEKAMKLILNKSQEYDQEYKEFGILEGDKESYITSIARKALEENGK